MDSFVSIGAAAQALGVSVSDWSMRSCPVASVGLSSRTTIDSCDLGAELVFAFGQAKLGGSLVAQAVGRRFAASPQYDKARAPSLDARGDQKWAQMAIIYWGQAFKNFFAGTILDGNHIKPLYQHRGQLVQGMRPDIGHPGTQQNIYQRHRFMPHHFNQKLIETAAHELGLSVSDFILTSMRERAEDVVRRQRTIQLTAEESRTFCTLLLQESVELPSALIEAITQHDKLVDSR